jgi:probable rRNA maturation factor
MRISITTKQASVPIKRAPIRKILRRVARSQGWTGDLSVAILDDAAIAAVNARFHGVGGPTDVLAFFYGADADGIEGEIVVSAETAQRVAASLDEKPERELMRYMVHGLLHLCGHDDHSPAGRRRMERMQERFLAEEEELRA